jgi:hypothetical protein
MWMVVQRKWMYLESIFVGSDDIRWAAGPLPVWGWPLLLL